MLYDLLEIEADTQQSPKTKPIIHMSLMVVTMVQLFGELTADTYLKLLKPIPIILLFFFFKNRDRQERLVIYGLGASLVGDLALMVRNDVLFQLGAGCFLIAHILYITAFSQDFSLSESKSVSGWHFRGLVLLSFLVVGVLGVNAYSLWNLVPNLLLFVIYGFMLSVMMLSAMWRCGKVKGKAYWYVMAGGLLFGMSDHILAFLKFHHYHTDIGEAVIIATYYLAQYFIVRGITRNKAIK